jgi:hypothetical protein
MILSLIQALKNERGNPVISQTKAAPPISFLRQMMKVYAQSGLTRQGINKATRLERTAYLIRAHKRITCPTGPPNEPIKNSPKRSDQGRRNV